MFIAKLNQVTLAPKRFFQDPLNTVSLGVSLLINIIHWVIVYFKIGSKNTTIILHYNVVYGTDMLARSRFLYLFPMAAFLVLIVNWSLASYFVRKEKLAAYFLNFSNLPVQLIFLTATIIILSANVQ